MSVITSQNWDGVTAPALPSGWSYEIGFATTTTHIVPLSSPNSLINADVGSDQTAYYQTADAVSGTVRVTAAFTSYTGGAASGSADARGAVFARARNPSPSSGATYYRATIALDQGMVTLAKYLAGTVTVLATVGGSFIGSYASSSGTWFALQLACNGQSLSVSVQRLSDSQWLQTNGTWAATQVACLTATDTDITGSGYAGLVLYNDSNGGEGSSVADAATDNFLFESVLDPKPQAIVVPAKYAWWLHD